MRPYVQSYLANGYNSLCGTWKIKIYGVCIDTCSGFHFASLHTREAPRKVIDPCLQDFNAMGLPKVIETDTGQAYTENNFILFFKEFGIEHKTGILYNPMGQRIVEHVHHTLKNWLLKTKRGIIPSKVTKITSCFCLICFKFFAN